MTKAKVEKKNAFEERVANSLNEIRMQCAAVREGILAGTMSHHDGMAVAKAVTAEAKIIQEHRRCVELQLQHSPNAALDLLLGG